MRGAATTSHISELGQVHNFRKSTPNVVNAEKQRAVKYFMSLDQESGDDDEKSSDDDEKNRIKHKAENGDDVFYDAMVLHQRFVVCNSFDLRPKLRYLHPDSANGRRRNSFSVPKLQKF
jgi:hypothetical protein